MSYRQLFADIVTRLEQEDYGLLVKDGDGNMIDTGLNRFVKNLISALKSDAPISVDKPIRINNGGEGPAILVVDTGNSNQVLEGFNASGEYVCVGIGLGSEGILANEVISHPNYSIDHGVAHAKYSNVGTRGGVAVKTPGTSFVTPGGHPGGGYGPENKRAGGVGSGYGTGLSGSGQPHKWRGGNDTFVVTPPYNTLIEGGGGTIGGSQVRKATITAVNDDTLTCDFPDGSSKTVARPFVFRKSDYDGQTIGGITYTYAGGANQERTADDGAQSETQVIVPQYAVNDELIAADVTNSGVSGVPWIDLNVDGKVWAKKPAGC